MEPYKVFAAAKRKGVAADPLALMPDPAAAVSCGFCCSDEKVRSLQRNFRSLQGFLESGLLYSK